MVSGVLLVLFDIPSEEKGVYRSFIKHLKVEGYQIMQKSIYYKVIRNIRLAEYNIKQMQKFKKDGCNIKAIVMTTSQFERINIISGEELSLNLDTVIII